MAPARTAIEDATGSHQLIFAARVRRFAVRLFHHH
jgi:hypothetical protein